MKHILLCLGLFATTWSAQAAEPNIEGFELVSAGIYTREVKSTERDAQGVLQHVVTDVKLVLSTTQIPAKLGVTFGIQYRLLGEPAGVTVTVRRETHYPSPGATPPGASVPLLVSTKEVKRTLNLVATQTYTLEEDWEVLPGKWRLEVWSGDRKLGGQEFTLVAP